MVDESVFSPILVEATKCAVCCDSKGRKINITSSKTLVGRCCDRP